MASNAPPFDQTEENAPTRGFAKGTKDAENVPPESIVSDVVEQRRISMDYLNTQVYGEWTEIYMSMKARVHPLTYKDDKGKEVEDRSRSNVAVPDHFVMVQRGVARLTRNSPNLRCRGGTDQKQRDMVAMLLMYQWDRANNQPQFRKMVHASKALGWGVGKVYWDNVTLKEQFRRRTADLTREDAARALGAPEEAIQQLHTMGQHNLPLADHEKAFMFQKFGDEVQIETPTTMYQGPVLENVFIGDVFPEPGFVSLQRSAWIIENSLRDEDWAEYWTRQTSVDPNTGEESPVIDPKKAQEVLDKAENRNWFDEKEMSLRRQFREAVGIGDPDTSGRGIKPPKKRFMVDERHMIINGNYCIDFVGEEGIYLGRLWYPVNLYGSSQYVEMTLIPDMVGGIGDSTPRITRFLYQLRNTRFNQITDFINNKLLPLFKVTDRSDVTQQSILRTAFGRLLRLKDVNSVQPFQDATFPAEAFEDTASLIREMQQADPAIADFAPGGTAVPQPGQLATALQLQKQSSDVVTADQLTQMGVTIRQIFERMLLMNQQLMQDQVAIDPTGMDNVKQLALSLRGDGADPKQVEINVGPYDIQYHMDILPEEGSTLASDDEYKTQALKQAIQVGEAFPQIVNLRAILTKYFAALPGISPEEAILPAPPPPDPNAPKLPPQMHMNLAIKWTDLPEDVQATILGSAKLPTTDTNIHRLTSHIKNLSEAADAATNLEEPVDHSRPDGARVPTKPSKSG